LHLRRVRRLPVRRNRAFRRWFLLDQVVIIDDVPCIRGDSRQAPGSAALPVIVRPIPLDVCQALGRLILGGG
jgi:hypothetical protein